MARRAKNAKKGAQLGLGLELKGTWGGKRRGAGRKRKAPRPRVSHARRPRFDGKRLPLHVTWRFKADLPTFRETPIPEILRWCLGRALDRFQTRVTSFTFQDNHVHMTVESASAEALGKAMQGLGVRIARAVNSLLGRRGPVVDDHYHASIIRNPTQMLQTIVYVLNNRRHHLAQRGRSMPKGWIDPCSSARSFRGWKEGDFIRATDPLPDPVLPPRTWLQREGWKKVGQPSIDTVPGRHEDPLIE